MLGLQRMAAIGVDDDRDVVELDAVLACRERGRDPVASIAAGQLLPLDQGAGESWRERRTQEVELPASLSVAVYQLSAVAGRGLPRAVTLAIL